MAPKSATSKGKGKPIAGNDKFVLPNGDVYKGEFLAFKKGTIFKHGIGTYTTWDGQIYEGRWAMDKLIALGEGNMISLEHADGTKYLGTLVNQQYHGENCQITFPDGSIMKSNFEKNTPVGKIHLIDPNNHEWIGKAELEYSKLLPMNHFYVHFPIDEIFTEIKETEEENSEENSQSEKIN